MPRTEHFTSTNTAVLHDSSHTAAGVPHSSELTRPRPRAVESLAQRHTAHKRKSWAAKPGPVAPWPVAHTFTHYTDCIPTGRRMMARISAAFPDPAPSPEPTLDCLSPTATLGASPCPEAVQHEAWVGAGSPALRDSSRLVWRPLDLGRPSTPHQTASSQPAPGLRVGTGAPPILGGDSAPSPKEETETQGKSLAPNLTRTRPRKRSRKKFRDRAVPLTLPSTLRLPRTASPLVPATPGKSPSAAGVGEGGWLAGQGVHKAIPTLSLPRFLPYRRNRGLCSQA